MKNLIRAITVFVLALSAGCATGASDLNVKDIPQGNQVFFGHIDFYNGQERLDGGSIYTRCVVTFENSNGNTVAKIATDESPWVFASAPVGRVYLASVICNAGFLKSHPQLDTKELFFDLSPADPTYFGHLEIHFNYHGTQVLGMFGLIGAATDAATSSGSKDEVEIKVDDKTEEAKAEYGKRYGNGAGPVVIAEAVVKQPVSK